MIYLALNKPVDFSLDRKENNNIFSLVDVPEDCFAINDLDSKSEGIVIVTNDASLKNGMDTEQEYEVTIAERMDNKIKEVIEKGLIIEGTFYKGITVANISNRGKRTVITIFIKGEKNEQIKKTFSALGLTIVSIKRKRIGRISLGTLQQGQSKEIKKDILFKELE